MPTSAVVDASVLVSTFLFPRSLPGDVVAAAEAGAYTLHLSPILIEETRRSLMNPRLAGPYGYGGDKVEAWCAYLKALAQMVTDLPDIGRVCRDADDDHVIAAAVGAKAGFIVTGDKDLLDLAAYGDIRIVTARTFATEILKIV